MCAVIAAVILNYSVKGMELAAGQTGVSKEQLLEDHSYYVQNNVFLIDVFVIAILVVAFLYCLLVFLGSIKNLRDYGGIKKYARSSAEVGLEILEEEMVRSFGNSIIEIKRAGPAPMGCYSISYDYKPMSYVIRGEAERGIITMEIINSEGKTFSADKVYPEAKRYFYDSSENVRILVELTHKAILEDRVFFE